MPVYRFEGPDGKVHRAEAASPEEAQAGLEAMWAQKIGREKPRRNAYGEIAGFMANVNRGLAVGDELAAAGNVLGGIVTGRHRFGADKPGNIIANNLNMLGDAYRTELAGQRQSEDSFRQAHPKAAALAQGTGWAIQAVPALLTGGASVAPSMLSTGVKATAGRMAMRAGKNAAVGGAYAAGNAVADRGTAKERLAHASGAVVPGAALGVAIPSAVVGVARAGGLVKRSVKAGKKMAMQAANSVASRNGEPILDPQREAVTRIVDALRRDRFTPDQITAALAEWRKAGGPSPAFMDLISRGGRGQNTMALFRGAAGAGSGRNVAAQYGAKVAADLQDNAIARTRQLTPDQRTVPAVEADINARIASNSAAPPVNPGQAGAQISARLNNEYDAGKRAVDEAYDLVRTTEADITAPTIVELPGRIRGALEDVLITPEVMGSLNPSTRAILGEIETLTGQAARLDRAAMPNPAASLEAGIPAGGAGRAPTFPVAQVERIRKAINLRLAKAQGEDEVALNIAKREFDAWLNAAVDNGEIIGDPAAVQALKDARALHAAQRTKFGGDDILERLTERDRHGAGRTNVVAPEDASNAILGRNGVSNGPDMVRDLTRLRDTLGAESPEWAALQQEAVARLLGRDAGTEAFGAAWARFAQENPQLANLLMSRGQGAALAASQRNIAGAVADRAALDAGRGILNTTPDLYAAGRPQQPLGQLSAARALEDSIGRPTEGATGVLNRISTATNMDRNLLATFGDEAPRYQQSIGQMVDQVNNARFINPNTGSQSFGRLADQTLVENIPTSKTGIVMALIRQARNGVPLTDQEREIVVRFATENLDELSPAIERALMARTHRFAMPATPNLLALPAGQSQGQTR